ncbi:MAG: ATP-dependent zinc protease [Alphaproteobacteria bacterium]|nr:ATP-dependent zinc protease [Alphaproteobacteria bacterium]
MRKVLCVLMVFILAACAEQKQNIVPGIVPNSAKEQKIIKILPKNVIGEVEPIYLPPMKSPFLSRIDTGATSSSFDAYEVKRFERDGKDWVSFKVINRETKEEHSFEKPLIRRVRIKRIGEEEHRVTVEMDVKMGGEKFKADFTIAERHDFEYQTLIGRNILGGRYAVDVSLSNTLK